MQWEEIRIQTAIIWEVSETAAEQKIPVGGGTPSRRITKVRAQRSTGTLRKRPVEGTSWGRKICPSGVLIPHPKKSRGRRE